MLNKWIAVLTRPSEAAFEAEKPNVNLTNMVIWLVIAGAIFGFFGGIGSLIFGRGEAGDIIVGLIVGAIVLPIAYFIGQGILYLVARLLGGTGAFTTQSYLISLFFVPLYIVGGVLSIVPCLGWLILFVLSLYALYLITLALKVTHHYDTVKAVITWLIPGIVLGVLLVCLAAVYYVALVIMVGSTF